MSAGASAAGTILAVVFLVWYIRAEVRYRNTYGKKRKR